MGESGEAGEAREAFLPRRKAVLVRKPRETTRRRAEPAKTAVRTQTPSDSNLEAEGRDSDRKEPEIAESFELLLFLTSMEMFYFLLSHSLLILLMDRHQTRECQSLRINDSVYEGLLLLLSLNLFGIQRNILSMSGPSEAE